MLLTTCHVNAIILYHDLTLGENIQGTDVKHVDLQSV